jgi:glucose-6-phosphate 1-dehydrogenase
MNDTEFRKRITSYIKNLNDNSERTAKIDGFVKTLTYKSGSYEEAVSFKELNKYLEGIESNYKSKDQGCNRFSYLAIPPNVVSPVAKNIKDECYLTTEDSLNRIIVQNWFGTDLLSCRNLTTSLHKSWSEQEIFRIDYYLGKAMVKNITCIRFANFRMEGDYVWMEGVWNRDSISNILIRLGSFVMLCRIVSLMLILAEVGGNSEPYLP